MPEIKTNRVKEVVVEESITISDEELLESIKTAEQFESLDGPFLKLLPGSPHLTYNFDDGTAVKLDSTFIGAGKGSLLFGGYYYDNKDQSTCQMRAHLTVTKEMRKNAHQEERS